MGLEFDGTDVKRADIGNRHPVSGHVFDANGDCIGGMILWTNDGILTSLEIWDVDDPGIQLPSPERVLWKNTG